MLSLEKDFAFIKATSWSFLLYNTFYPYNKMSRCALKQCQYVKICLVSEFESLSYFHFAANKHENLIVTVHTVQA